MFESIQICNQFFVAIFPTGNVWHYVEILEAICSQTLPKRLQRLRHDESPFELLHKNKLFLIIVLAITLVQVVMVQASEYFHIGEIFRTMPLDGGQWLGITLLTVTIIPVAWLSRMVCYWMGFEKSLNETDIHPTAVM